MGGQTGGPAASTLVPVTTRGGLGEGGLRFYRSVAGARMRSRWQVDERGTFRVPQEGPVIFASNHIGWIDGPLMIALSPRPAHALVKAEAFRGMNGLLLRIAAQIQTHRDRTDTGALRAAVKTLRAGQAVMIWPEGTRGDGEFHSVHQGVGYLAAVSGAPVVPVALFGTRPAGAGVDVKPVRRATIEIMYGEPFTIESRDWPRTQTHVREATARIAGHLRAHLEQAKRNSHIGLPGPLENTYE